MLLNFSINSIKSKKIKTTYNLSYKTEGIFFLATTNFGKIDFWYQTKHFVTNLL